MTQRTASDGVTSEGSVWGVGDPKDEETLAKQIAANDAVAGGRSSRMPPSTTSTRPRSRRRTPMRPATPTIPRTTSASSATHGEVEPGADNQDTTVSQLTDALDSDALVSIDTPETDAMGSER